MNNRRGFDFDNEFAKLSEFRQKEINLLKHDDILKRRLEIETRIRNRSRLYLDDIRYFAKGRYDKTSLCYMNTMLMDNDRLRTGCHLHNMITNTQPSNAGSGERSNDGASCSVGQSCESTTARGSTAGELVKNNSGDEKDRSIVRIGRKNLEEYECNNDPTMVKEIIKNTEIAKILLGSKAATVKKEVQPPLSLPPKPRCLALSLKRRLDPTNVDHFNHKKFKRYKDYKNTEEDKNITECTSATVAFKVSSSASCDKQDGLSIMGASASDFKNQLIDPNNISAAAPCNMPYEDSNSNSDFFKPDESETNAKSIFPCEQISSAPSMTCGTSIQNSYSSDIAMQTPNGRESPMTLVGPTNVPDSREGISVDRSSISRDSQNVSSENVVTTKFPNATKNSQKNRILETCQDHITLNKTTDDSEGPRDIAVPTKKKSKKTRTKSSSRLEQRVSSSNDNASPPIKPFIPRALKKMRKLARKYDL
ncbi:uncharacterized protein Ecym_4222 [Eremothecium cymbalariae DBVPG|uniref:Uncharacterized protein n=1 Tax=Eremothecium cymbalariae (strain CBS 270.75 / DBVPG 7215 / KCTC 17166 / NRRL Y-17582) TaxID=931890 RepID=G8JTD6_ERECY|nr:hypothetical protein Ecym_4222 [Eremothecium cymbalariae DBVPG\